MKEQTTIEVGTHKEERAQRFLEERGLVTVRTNYRCRLGEIDLIMNDRGILVFVEVRYRSSGNYGGARESVTSTKRKKIERVAQLYLQSFSKLPPCRFDVVLIEGGAQPEWVKAAW